MLTSVKEVVNVSLMLPMCRVVQIQYTWSGAAAVESLVLDLRRIFSALAGHLLINLRLYCLL